MKKSRTWLHSLSIALLAFGTSTLMAQSPSTFKYEVTDGSDAKVGGGELRLGGSEKVGLEIGAVKTEVSDGGEKVSVTATAKTDVSWLTSTGTVSTQAVVDPKGETIVRGFSKSGAPTYQVTDNADGSRKIQLFQDGKVSYLLTIGSKGEFSLSTPIASQAATKASTKAPVTKPTSTTTKPVASTKPAATTASRPSSLAIPANIQVISNSPPPLP